MAKTWSGKITHTVRKKATSQGVGGRSRSVKCSTSTMNKHKKRSYKKYRGQGRQMALTEDITVSANSWSNANPNELDYLRPNGFKFQVHNIPNTSYMCQAANIPEISVGNPTQFTPLVDIPIPGDKLEFGALQIMFIIQEDMMNYKELYDWLIGMGFPEDRKQYQQYGEQQTYRFPQVADSTRNQQGLLSDASLFILDSNNNPSVTITFRDCFPTSLGGLNFEIVSGSTDYMQAVAMFRYKDYLIETAAGS